MGIDTWVRQDLEALIGLEESGGLEFKRSEALNNRQEMVKDVTAMANADGGTIVYGMIEGDDGCAVGLDDGVEQHITADWIFQILNSNIEPKLHGLTVRAISLEGGRHAFALEVPKAMASAPHQSRFAQRYYRRWGKEVLAMYDHEIRDVMRRSTVPDLYFEFMLSEVDVDTFEFGVSARNASAEPAHFGHAKLFLDAALQIGGVPSGFSTSSLSPPLTGSKSTTVLSKTWSAPSNLPWFKEQPLMWLSGKVTIYPRTTYPVAYKITAQGCSVYREGVIRRHGDRKPIVQWHQEQATPE